MTAQAALSWLSSHQGVIPAIDIHHREALQHLTSQSRTRGDLAAIIARDPGMSISLYLLVNGYLRKSGKCSVDTIGTALGLLGDTAIQEFLQEHKVLNKTHADPATRQSYQQLVSRCYHAQAQLDGFIGIQRVQAVDEVREAALLVNVAEFYLCLYDHASYRRYLEQIQSNGSPDGIAVKVFNFEFKSLGQLLAKQLALPELVSEIHTPGNFRGFKPGLIALASEVSVQAELGWQLEAMKSVEKKCADYLNKPAKGFYRQLHQNAVTAAKSCHLADVFPAASRLILQPRNGTVTQLAAPIKPPVESQTDRSTPDFATQMKALLNSPGTDQTRLMDALLRHLHIDLQLSPVVFLILTKDKRNLAVQMGKGIKPDSPIRNLVVNITKEGILKSLIAKPQALSIDSEKYRKFEGLLPSSIKTAFNPENLFLMSLYVDDKPRGLIICNPGADQSEPDRARYLKFRSAIQLTGKALSFQLKRSQRSAA
jgi:hypothetical protein